MIHQRHVKTARMHHYFLISFAIVILITIVKVHVLSLLIQNDHGTLRVQLLNERQNSKSSQKMENADINKNEETSHLPTKSYYDGFSEQTVPKNVSRFDFPWRVPERVRLLSPEDSNNRILYSPVKEFYITGLGHSMGIVNAEIMTAMRLNLTYTHRIARYYAHSVPFDDFVRKTRVFDNLSRPFLHVGSVEHLFGWGVGEIPRDHVQQSICTSEMMHVSDTKCSNCNNTHLELRKIDLKKVSTINSGHPQWNLAMQIDDVVELPFNLSYKLPEKFSRQLEDYAKSFFEKHSKPNTVFTMPSEVCNKNPTSSMYTREQRSFFFHKYWDAHGHNSIVIDTAKFENETFDVYKRRVTSNERIGVVGRRPILERLDEGAINVAVHARRGDFFHFKRNMISVLSIAKIIRQTAFHIIKKGPSQHASLPISVSIYSEGKEMNETSVPTTHHDVTKMNREFIDTDGSVYTITDVEKILLDNSYDNYGDVFKQGLKVHLRISENTILCIHEMISSDLFIGSDSSLSYSIVGCHSRAAFLLLPQTRSYDPMYFIKFNQSGVIENAGLEKMKFLWQRFSLRNAH